MDAGLPPVDSGMSGVDSGTGGDGGTGIDSGSAGADGGTDGGRVVLGGSGAGCACRVGQPTDGSGQGMLFGLGLAALLFWRRRR